MSKCLMSTYVPTIHVLVHIDVSTHTAVAELHVHCSVLANRCDCGCLSWAIATFHLD